MKSRPKVGYFVSSSLSIISAVRLPNGNNSLMQKRRFKNLSAFILPCQKFFLCKKNTKKNATTCSLAKHKNFSTTPVDKFLS